MSPFVWVFASISVVTLFVVVLFLYFCRGNIWTKSISTILVSLAAVGGSKVAPDYKARFNFNNHPISFDGDITAGGASTDTTILIAVFGVTLILLVWCATQLKLKDKWP
jgi:hypothetical protein